VSEHQDTRDCRRQGRQEQARLFQSEYDGSRDTSAREFIARRLAAICHASNLITRLQLNSEADPKDEHHILRMRDQFIHHKHLCIVFECLSSNLYELIKHNQFRGLSLQLVKMFTTQLLDALTVLKEARLIHCDLKPENILLKR
jgi:serine/threonine protein kinase